MTTQSIYKRITPSMTPMSDPITFHDHEGNLRSYRYYHWLGRTGITDIKGEKVIFPARYFNVEIDPQSEVIIAGDDGIGWRIFPLPGSVIGQNICNSGIVPNFFRRLKSAKRWLVGETRFC